MERLANRVANKLASELSYTEEQKLVLVYGLIAIFQTVLMTAIVLLAGALLHAFIESAILCFAVSILRSYSGGAHASSIASCTIVGVVFCAGFGVAMSQMARLAIPLAVLTVLGGLVFVSAFYVAIQKAPVDSPNKPIRSESKKKKMKLATMVVLFLYLVVSAVLLFNYSRSSVFVSALLSLLLSVVWQMGSLTTPGRVFLEGLDRLVYGRILLKGGHSNEKD